MQVTYHDYKIRDYHRWESFCNFNLKVTLTFTFVRVTVRFILIYISTILKHQLAVARAVELENQALFELNYTNAVHWS